MDFLFGKSKKEYQVEVDARRKAEVERQKAESDKKRLLEEKQRSDAELRDKEARIKKIEEEMRRQSEDNRKTQEQMKKVIAASQAQETEAKKHKPEPEPQPKALAEDKQKIDELEKRLKAKDEELRAQQVKQTMELYKKQTMMEAEVQKKKTEVDDLLKKLKDEEGKKSASGGSEAQEIVHLKEELKKKEDEIKKKEEELESKEITGWVTSIDTLDASEFPPEVLRKKEELERKEKEINKKEAELAQQVLKAQDMIKTRRNEFSARFSNLTFDNFIIGPSNRFPFEVCQAVAKNPAEAYNPLYIYGGVGLGKTHLLASIGNYIMASQPNCIVVYVSSETFTNELMKAVEEAKLEDFRNRYRNIDVLLIDDIQFIGKQETTQEEFFHTFNALYNNNKQIIIASDRPPKDIPTLESRLRSRFEGGLITDIKTPDQGTRMMILKKKAAKDKIMIPGDVLTFLASNIRSNVRTLIGGLNKVTAYSNMAHKDLSVDMCKEVLADVIESESKIEEEGVE